MTTAEGGYDMPEKRISPDEDALVQHGWQPLTAKEGHS